MHTDQLSEQQQGQVPVVTHKGQEIHHSCTPKQCVLLTPSVLKTEKQASKASENGEPKEETPAP